MWFHHNTEAATASSRDSVVGMLPRDVLKSSVTNNLGEGFELGPHFYRLTDKIVLIRLESLPRSTMSQGRYGHFLQSLLPIKPVCSGKIPLLDRAVDHSVHGVKSRLDGSPLLQHDNRRILKFRSHSTIASSSKNTVLSINSPQPPETQSPRVSPRGTWDDDSPAFRRKEKM
jgi:hypothetical protein